MERVKQIFTETLETTIYVKSRLVDGIGRREVFDGSYGPIVALHGVLGGWPSNGLRNYMQERAVAGVLCEFGLLIRPVDSYLPELERELEKFPHATIVGISTGGLLAVRYAQINGWGEFKKIITVGSPFKGVGLVNPLRHFGGVFNDIVENSLFLQQLFNQNVPEEKLINVFARKDQYVGNPEKINVPGTKIIVGAIGHGNLGNNAHWIKDILDREIGITNENSRH